MLPNLVGKDFGAVRAALAGRLYDATTGCGTFVLYNVGPLRQYGKLDVIALGDTVEAAEAALEGELLERLAEV